jgi:hypothetical protein
LKLSKSRSNLAAARGVRKSQTLNRNRLSITLRHLRWKLSLRINLTNKLILGAR